ncbi:52 kDa repressor of the inhibitor of the protein kinase-like [Zootoca vivipara]|uniref:52 kDa repressor of the inhibitor of the protein kinase-like n=1 Tax=Zootoca vivipara TaxID=8524 RepID=UPI00293BE22C|nr:52 kDa repressor of the inhibitor of the protein kinase-like [Zootoca vivipara]
MDIRSWFQKGGKPIKRKQDDERSESNDNDRTQRIKASKIMDEGSSNCCAPVPATSTAIEENGGGYHENDIGRYLDQTLKLSTEKKKELLSNPWIPPQKYDFGSDASHLKRKFNRHWLDQYTPWLVYSSLLKGALCNYCVLFPPAIGTIKGILGSFIVRPYTRFKNIHEDCKKHASSHHHKMSTAAAKAFLENVPVDVQLQSGHQKRIEENKQILSSIISCIIFCGTHDLPLRGKEGDEGVFFDLLNLRIDCGDEKLKSHLEKCQKNAIYTSPKIQNEIIKLCGQVVKERIIEDCKQAKAYAVMADETADIGGKEQLSIGLRFYDESQKKIREEFVGYVELKSQDAPTIASAIHSFLVDQNLPADNCVGFGFDGCSTMAGKEGGVQAILKKKYRKSLFFHCSSHKLNLVVNDASKLPEIRNTIATVKDTISFFRESPARRNSVPNLSRLCETRWSEKYMSIRKFSESFHEIVNALEHLSVEGNYATRKSAYQLHCAVTKPIFIVGLVMIAKYSAILEPVVNILQGKNMDLIMVREHIGQILDRIKTDRQDIEHVSDDLLKKANDIAEKVGVELSVPRMSQKQIHRSNPPSETAIEYWRRSLIIPYLDSLTLSLNVRFSHENTPAFALSHLHPSYMLQMASKDLEENAKSFMEFYELGGISAELGLWYDLWKKKDLAADTLKDIEVAALLEEANRFYPTTRHALLILSAFPSTTATVERSFSTLRRVKTWLRSTMGQDRLTGLCLMSVHRKFFKENQDWIETKVLKKFSSNPRKMILV